MTILVTGFEPFGSVTDNPSQRIVEYLEKQNRPEIMTKVLRVDYEMAADGAGLLVEIFKPDAVLLLGVAQKREEISLERIAININDASIPDNEGILRQGQPIIENAPVGFRSTLPLDAMYKAIQSADIPVTYSNHAGAYLCNHVMYSTLHYLDRIGRDTPCGFIHVPDVTAVSLEKQIKAVVLCIGVLMREKTLP